MEYRFPDMRILLFAREPVRGRVKTRLHEEIGPDAAYDLYCGMLRYQINTIRSSRLAPLELWVSGNPDNPELTSLGLEDCTFEQSGADLGERMHFAVSAAMERSRAVLLLGVDSPSIDRDYLELALTSLEAGRQVLIGPAEDGGYVLLGLSGVWQELFQHMPWGTDRVYAMTLERTRQLDLDVDLLPERWDVDRPEDLEKLAGLEPPLDINVARLKGS